ncbi:RelA/SpoT domain-containing protein [Ancylobacter radicis]|uniref:RelA/SpoT domain-containing protein n=1 Tax=Ancylobacter radicis TaxID=2836179 RepID=A0ABS5R8F5_9HYPH|nr:RelA/SpoT domain-containing protein [Ancylobacter radicis]MBS9477422.1 hypothetical protein [Ancylobacter radicis]
MRTLEQAYASSLKMIEIVEGQAKEALSDFCNSRSYILVNRLKNVDSVRDKIETGRYSSFLMIDDLIAFSIIIDTSAQTKDVISYLRKAFKVKSIKSGKTLIDERTFDFDCPRVYCSLNSNHYNGTGLNEIIFEIQIRTILQHAWSKITHPVVYKGHQFDPRASRLAAELMAHIEKIDRTFSRFKTESRNVKYVGRYAAIASSRITQKIDELIYDGVIPSEMRPKNGKRLGENIYNSLIEKNRIDAAIGVIDNFYRSLGSKFPRSVSLYQLAIVALYNAKLLDLKSNKKRYYVSSELTSLYPQIEKIRNTVDI